MKKKSLKCICCGFEIKSIEEPFPNENLWEGMWHGGIVERISAGYGSQLDGEMYILAICDNCIKEKKENGLLKYIGNYM